MTQILPSEVNRSLQSLNLVLDTAHSIPEIPQLLNQTVLLGGKRLRPALCFMLGQILGVPSQKISPFARSAEFTHSASLAHDDVLDNAVLRRNIPTLNAKTSNARAVLAGDLLLARVMVELANQGDINIIRDLAHVVEDLVNGEWLQLQARGNVDVTREHLLEVAHRKTASLMGWCCRVAARLSAPSNERLIEAATQFGRSLGVAFQMVDDVIDFEPTSEKEFAKDCSEGLVNFVVAEILNANPSLKKDVQNLIGKGQAEWPWSDSELNDAKSKVRDLASVYLDQAKRNLEVVLEYQVSTPEADECVQSLQGLLMFLGMRNV